MISQTQAKLICHKLEVCNKSKEELITFSFLAKGNHNINYFLQTKKNKYVLRVENNQQFKNLKKEYHFLRSAKPGLGPKVILFDNSHQIIPHDYMIEEFIAGKHPPHKPSDEFVALMAKWFKKLHQTTKKVASQSPYSLKKAVRPYYQNYLKYKHHITDAKLRQKVERLVDQALQIIEKNNTIFWERKTVSLLHNDSSRENIFYTPSCIRLIDWEFVGYGLPEREIVYFFDSYNLTERQNALFLQRYAYPQTKKAQRQLTMAYLVLLFSSIGYSLWRLDLHLRGKEKQETRKRLLRDINLLEKKINI